MTVDPTAPVHPTFLYESIWCLVGFLALAAFFKKRRFNGQIFLGYVIWYGLGRAWIEGLRTDSLLIGSTGLRASQLVAIGSVLAGSCADGHRPAQRQGKNADRHAGCEGHQKAGRGRGAVHPDTLPANAPHAEFVKATDAMNARLDALDLNTVEIEEIEGPQE